MNTLLEARRITKSFLFRGNRTVILQDLDLAISEHEFVTIIGSSGCGKSTLLELFAGITIPDSGEIIFQDKVINGIGGYLGYMPQDDLLFPWLNTLQNCLLPVRVKKGDIRAAKVKILELIPVFGLEEHVELLPSQLSGGLRQRVALLRTYMTASPLLLLDEPFANLDALTRVRMQDWLMEIRKKLNLTILMVTHDINEAIRLSDRVLLMDKNPGRFSKEYRIDPASLADPIRTQALYSEMIASL